MAFNSLLYRSSLFRDQVKEHALSGDYVHYLLQFYGLVYPALFTM